MEERYVVSYLDLNTDRFNRLYFNSKEEAEDQFKQIKANEDYMSELIMSESDYEQHEMDMAIMEEEYEDDF